MVSDVSAECLKLDTAEGILTLKPLCQVLSKSKWFSFRSHISLEITDHVISVSMGALTLLPFKHTFSGKKTYGSWVQTYLRLSTKHSFAPTPQTTIDVENVPQGDCLAHGFDSTLGCLQKCHSAQAHPPQGKERIIILEIMSDD